MLHRRRVQRIAHGLQAGWRRGLEDQARGRAVLLKIADRAREKALPCRDQKDANQHGQTGRTKNDLEIGEQRFPAAFGNACFNALGQKWAEEGIGRTADQHQHVEQRKTQRNSPRANAGNAGGIGQRADQIDRGSQQADDQQLGVHGRDVGPAPKARQC